MFRRREAEPQTIEKPQSKLPDFKKVFDLSKSILHPAADIRFWQDYIEKEKVRADEKKHKMLSLMFDNVSQYFEHMSDKQRFEAHESKNVITKTAKGKLQLDSYESIQSFAVILLGSVTEEPQDVGINIVKKHTTEGVRIGIPPATTAFSLKFEHQNGYLKIDLSKYKNGQYDINTSQISNKPEISAVLNSVHLQSHDKQAENLYNAAQILHLLSKVKLEEPES